MRRQYEWCWELAGQLLLLPPNLFMPVLSCCHKEASNDVCWQQLFFSHCCKVVAAHCYSWQPAPVQVSWCGVGVGEQQGMLEEETGQRVRGRSGFSSSHPYLSKTPLFLKSPHLFSRNCATKMAGLCLRTLKGCQQAYWELCQNYFYLPSVCL